MARKHHEESGSGGRLERAASAVKRLFSRETISESSAVEPQQQHPRQAAPSAPTSRPVRRQTDIPLDVLDRSYNPPRTSSKTGFRSDGSDHQGDQEFATGAPDGQWNDEDRYTNRSGDPRIGTHGRTYEPAEARTESRD